MTEIPSPAAALESPFVSHSDHALLYEVIFFDNVKIPTTILMLSCLLLAPVIASVIFHSLFLNRGEAVVSDTRSGH